MWWWWWVVVMVVVGEESCIKEDKGLAECSRGRRDQPLMCHKVGHLAEDCWHKKAAQEQIDPLAAPSSFKQTEPLSDAMDVDETESEYKARYERLQTEMEKLLKELDESKETFEDLSMTLGVKDLYIKEADTKIAASDQAFKTLQKEFQAFKAKHSTCDQAEDVSDVRSQTTTAEITALLRKDRRWADEDNDSLTGL